MTHCPRVFHHVRHEDAEDFLRLGWLPAPEPQTRVHHDDHAVTMLWLCDCEPPTLARRDRT